MRKIYFLLLLSLTVFNLSAGNIDILTARKVAQGFVGQKLSSGNVSLSQASSDFTVSQNGRPVYFIVSLEPKGFIIVPAHDAAPPVLGYSLENNYSDQPQPENFSQWLQGYSNMVSYLKDNNITPSQANIAQWNALIENTSAKSVSTTTTVGPLIPCSWNQSYPYNYLCPTDPNGSGGHVYSGCVATAMSQVMYYWRYPQHGTGSHGYTWDPYGYLFADFGSTTYHWEDMTLSTSNQNFEMAQLQLQLGISVDMMYSGSGSGAYSQDAATALKTYFGYDQSLELVNSDDYPYEGWKSLLRAQIDAGQPMYYNGYGSGGHAFNLDGYQDTMFFHFNWGWGGSYNGYFHLFNLNPGGSNFNNGQGAIINFIPAVSSSLQCGLTDTLTTLEATMEDGSGPVAPYFNNTSCNWLIMPDDTLENIKLDFQRFDLENGKDFIYVYDGSDANAPLIGSYTGNSIPPETAALSGSMFIRFVTDGSGTSNGWLASYTAKQAQFCSGTTLLTSPAGSFGDGSGGYNYHNNTMCRYEIKPENARSVSIAFTELNTAGEGDFIAIYNNVTHELYNKLYGQDNPGTLNFNTGDLMIIFKSDNGNTAAGWNLEYTSSGLTGINQDPSGLNPIVSPNPAQTMLQINVKTSTEGYSLALYSSEGKMVYSEDSRSTQSSTVNRIDVSQFTRGIYVLQIRSKKGISYQKVVLN
ncbi:MAG: C10 family peptidase [Bacteroidota bacterium]